MNPVVDTQPVTKRGNNLAAGGPEEINTHNKHQGVNDPRHYDPLPKLVLPYKAMRPGIWLNGGNDFFQQVL